MKRIRLITPLLTGFYGIIFEETNIETPIRYNGHLTLIDGVYFASIQQPDLEKSHLIVELKLDRYANKLSVKLLESDDITENYSKKQLGSYIRNNINNLPYQEPYLFEYSKK